MESASYPIRNAMCQVRSERCTTLPGGLHLAVRRIAMLMFVFIVFVAFALIAGVFISIEEKRRRDGISLVTELMVDAKRKERRDTAMEN